MADSQIIMPTKRKKISDGRAEQRVPERQRIQIPVYQEKVGAGQTAEESGNGQRRVGQMDNGKKKGG